MKLFLSWSGEKSHKVARALMRWLPTLFQTVGPWMSTEDIPPGIRWANVLAIGLEEAEFAVLCLTKENLNAPWILFEAGVLSKSLTAGRVVPYLIDLEPSDLDGPLAQFQAVVADEQGTRKLITAIAKSNPNNIQSEEILDKVFRVWWPELRQILDGLQ